MIAKICFTHFIYEKKGMRVLSSGRIVIKKNVSQRRKREKKIRKEICSVIKVGNGWGEGEIRL